MKSPLIRPLRPSDLRDWHRQIGTSRGWAAELDGEVIGYGGLLYSTPLPQAFSLASPEIKRYPRTIVKMGRLLTGLLSTLQCDVYAHADEGEPTSERFLTHLGFEHVVDRLYVWRNTNG